MQTENTERSHVSGPSAVERRVRDAARNEWYEGINNGKPYHWRDVGPDEIWAAAWEAATAAERERCARVCESFGGNGLGYIDDDWARMCAAAIRDS